MASAPHDRLTRRQWTHWGLGGLGAVASGLISPWAAFAQTAASTPPALGEVTLLIPANPGGGWDATGRALGQALLQLGMAQQVRYENRGGAAGTIGLAQFAANRHTQPNALMVMGSVMLGGIITGKPPVTLDQVQPLARLTNEYNVFVLPPRSPFSSMAEVLRQFKANPGSIKWGGGSRGSTEHIVIHMMAKAMGIDSRRINYIPFRGGGEAAAATMGGHVTVGGSGYSEFKPFMQQNRMRAIAVTSAERLPGVDAPTLTELKLPVVLGNWRGVCLPGGLSDADQTAWVQRLNALTTSARWRDTVRQHGWSPEPLVGEPFEAFVQTSFHTLQDILHLAGLD